MQIPDEILGKLQRADRPRKAIHRWQWSLRTLFILTTVCGVLAWFHAPLWAWCRAFGRFGSLRYDPIQCGPCGMG